MSGEAVISGNTAAKGSGVYFGDGVLGGGGAFTMSGRAVVKQEVFLESGKQITVSGELLLPTGETYSAEIRPANTSNGAEVLKGIEDNGASGVYPLNFADISKFRLSPQSSGGGRGFSLNTDDNSVKLVDETSETGGSYYSGGDTRIYGDLATIINNVSGTPDAPAIISIVEDIRLPPPTANGAINISRKHIKLTVPDNTEISIRRNGYSGRLFNVNAGASLTLEAGMRGSLTLDGGWDGVQTQSANSSIIEISAGGKLTMGDGVKLKNNKRSDGHGGGVYLNGGLFEMTGGEISGNSTSYSGGGVYVDGGTFTMSGGMISGNTITGSGGGVYLRNRGIFRMTGGMISGNTSDNNGGGVLVWDGNFTMSSAVISGNSTTSSGGGVYVSSNGTFTMEGGAVISGNSATTSGGGIYLNTGTFTMSGGIIYGRDEGDLSNTAGQGAAIGGTTSSENTVRPEPAPR
jgi:hypothetical protein